MDTISKVGGGPSKERDEEWMQRIHDAVLWVGLARATPAYLAADLSRASVLADADRQRDAASHDLAEAIDALLGDQSSGHSVEPLRFAWKESWELVRGFMLAPARGARVDPRGMPTLRPSAGMASVRLLRRGLATILEVLRAFRLRARRGPPPGLLRALTSGQQDEVLEGGLIAHFTNHPLGSPTRLIQAVEDFFDATARITPFESASGPRLCSLAFMIRRPVVIEVDAGVKKVAALLPWVKFEYEGVRAERLEELLVPNPIADDDKREAAHRRRLDAAYYASRILLALVGRSREPDQIANSARGSKLKGRATSDGRRRRPAPAR